MLLTWRACAWLHDSNGYDLLSSTQGECVPRRDCNSNRHKSADEEASKYVCTQQNGT